VNGAQDMNTLEGRQAMESKARLTRRGKIVLSIFIFVVVCWLYDITTPDQCKVAIENMSQFCKDLRYP
jgi:fibrillarin-like rRNA methylase